MPIDRRWEPQLSKWVWFESDEETDLEQDANESNVSLPNLAWRSFSRGDTTAEEYAAFRAGYFAASSLIPRNNLTPEEYTYNQLRGRIIQTIDNCIPDNIPGYRQRYTDRAADALMKQFDLIPRNHTAREDRNAAH